MMNREMELFNTINYKGYNIKIYHDNNPEDPRGWNNLGHMVCLGRYYQLGDKHNLIQKGLHSWAEVEEYLIKNLGAVICLPLYHDHNGLSMKAGGLNEPIPQGYAEWDYSRVGFIYVTKNDLKKEWNTKLVTNEHIEEADRILRSEVVTYDNYLSGNVWGFIIKKGDKDIDSCWGFYGHDYRDGYMIEHAKEVVEWDIERTKS